MKSQGVISILVALIGFVTFTLLLLNEKIGVLGYFSLLSLLSFVCVVIPVLSRLKELDVRNLKLTLEKIEQAKGEIYAKEESLKETSYILSELIAANSTLMGMWGDENSSKYSKALVRNKINKLGASLDIPKDKIDDLFKYERALKELQKYKGEERDKKWQEFIDLLRVGAEENT
ncbi:hypothetical protein [Halomonas sp. CSM-2]|uniref:hypothetical protein n=1 Tax=Halomonas sp. CSM-2 TaxID=1975722 RepID=UPI000A28BC9A|nr:hypothetical protein [Halomonas sp. CSM-2]